MPAIFTNQTPGTVARTLLVTLLMLWLVTGGNLFGYRYWNVTQDKYEAALAKWHSLPIAEYEETLKLYGSGTWKIVVRVERTNGNRVEKVVSLQSVDEIATNLKEKHAWDAEYFEESWTVNARFQGIRLLLEHPDRLNPSFHGRINDDFSEILFDPVMGYPYSHTLRGETETIELFLAKVKVLR